MYTFLTDREFAFLRVRYRCVVEIIELFEIQTTRSLATCHYSFALSSKPKKALQVTPAYVIFI
jgi:hypothetical protein